MWIKWNLLMYKWYNPTVNSKHNKLWRKLMNLNFVFMLIIKVKLMYIHVSYTNRNRNKPFHNFCLSIERQRSRMFFFAFHEKVGKQNLMKIYIFMTCIPSSNREARFYFDCFTCLRRRPFLWHVFVLFSRGNMGGPNLMQHYKKAVSYIASYK